MAAALRPPYFMALKKLKNINKINKTVNRKTQYVVMRQGNGNKCLWLLSDSTKLKKSWKCTL